MYDDYKVVYESNINEYLIFWIILGVILFALLLIILISISKVLKKANRSPIHGLIPIYNLIPLLEITNMSKSYFFPLIIPIVNIPFLLMLNLELAKFFKKDKKFGVLLLVLPFVYFPILAFGKSEYIGINLTAMNSKNTIKNIPIIDDTKNNQIEKEINDEIDISTNSSSISLGGGKYQKNYKNSLLQVEEGMIAKGENKQNKKENVISPGKFFSSEMVKSTENTPNEPINNATKPFNVSYIDKSQEKFSNAEEQIQSTKIIEPQQQKFVSNPLTTETEEKVDLLKRGEYRPRSCPNCGTRVADNANMCIICGQKL